MHIGDWNQVVLNPSEKDKEPLWLQNQAPRDACQLLNFSQHLAEWLPKGAWKILQIDNSTSFDVISDNFIGRKLFGPAHLTGIAQNKTILFEFGKSREQDRNTELVIVDLIFSFLLLEAHCYLVSSGGPRISLGLQDGHSYFFGTAGVIKTAQDLVTTFADAPTIAPPWIVEIISDEPMWLAQC